MSKRRKRSNLAGGHHLPQRRREEEWSVHPPCLVSYSNFPCFLDDGLHGQARLAQPAECRRSSSRTSPAGCSATTWPSTSAFGPRAKSGGGAYAVWTGPFQSAERIDVSDETSPSLVVLLIADRHLGQVSSETPA
ncbi:hypothetical protein ZWY2020_010230 [Hordeum vulgare]|nr:hypothetical protein ZWY2020_010230 [Hordeum vulgare]